MADFVRIRAGQTRRKERKAERFITLAAVSPKDSADAERAQDNVEIRLSVLPSHAGEQSRTDH
jgi:hypothetical protein